MTDTPSCKMILRNYFTRRSVCHEFVKKTEIIKSFHTYRSKWMKWLNALISKMSKNSLNEIDCFFDYNYPATKKLYF